MDGKSDRLDAEQIARAVLGQTSTATPKTKSGMVEVIRTLRVTRASACTGNRRERNARSMANTGSCSTAPARSKSWPGKYRSRPPVGERLLSARQPRPRRQVTGPPNLSPVTEGRVTRFWDLGSSARHPTPPLTRMDMSDDAASSCRQTAPRPHQTCQPRLRSGGSRLVVSSVTDRHRLRIGGIRQENLHQRPDPRTHVK